jgi:hypothetical protein
MRQEEVKLLRGMPASIPSTTLDLSEAGLGVTTTPVRTLPPNVVVDRQERVMWAAGETGWTVWDRYARDFQRACDVPRFATGLTGWSIPSANELIALRTDAAGPQTFAAIGMGSLLDAATRGFWTSDFWRDGRKGLWVPKPGRYFNMTESTFKGPDDLYAGSARNDFLDIPAYQRDLEWKTQIYRRQHVKNVNGKFEKLAWYEQWRPDGIHPDHWKHGMVLVPRRLLDLGELDRYVEP